MQRAPTTGRIEIQPGSAHRCGQRKTLRQVGRHQFIDVATAIAAEVVRLFLKGGADGAARRQMTERTGTLGAYGGWRVANRCRAKG